MKRLALALSLCGAPFTAFADTNTDVVTADYQKLIRGRGDLVSLGPDLFGDRVSLYMGDLEFVQTDIALTGNNDLPVSIARRYVPISSNLKQRSFRDWELEIPNIHGVFAERSAANTKGWAPDRCSNAWAPAGVSSSDGSYFPPDVLWQGTFVYIPGTGDMELLRNGNPVRPSDGKTYYLTTRDKTIFRCVPSLDSTSETTGEGFEMVRPDGTVYRFDHLVAQPAPGFMDPLDKPIKRNELVILPTKITDRFGNTVTYSWSGRRLVSIVASDGRALYATGYPISSVTDGTRTWSYQYTSDPNKPTLSSVTLPDASSWSFNLVGMYGDAPADVGVKCNGAGIGTFDANGVGTSRAIGTITHPSGAVGEFTLANGMSGRSWVAGECASPMGSTGDEGKAAVEPRILLGWRILKKKITGPGLASAGLTWNYNFGPPNHCWDPNTTASAGFYPDQAVGFCSASSPVTREVQVVAPDGTVTRYTYGNRFRQQEGKLLRVDYGWNGSTAIRSVAYSYRAASAGPYPESFGSSMQTRGDYSVANSNMPEETVITDEGGVRYVRQVSAFDSLARPTSITRSNNATP